MKTVAALKPASQPSVPKPTYQALPDDLRGLLEALPFEAKPKLAMLIRWSDAEEQVDRGGTEIRLEQLAWRGVQDLCRDILRDIEGLERASGVNEGDDFVMLPDNDGGVR